jgi:hypothetical protein
MMSGAKHNEAASICDKVVFSKVIKLGKQQFLIMCAL